MSDVVVSTQNLSKCFKVYRNPWDRALEWVGSGKRHEEYWALRDVSFEINRGECLGVIGANGAGKSTLLKILTRALYPSGGSFSIKGNVMSLLELGTGFNPELTGRQNLYHSSRILGFPDQYIASRIEEIEAFAELGDSFNRPIKTYSTGMTVRLAFSLFICMEPEVLIVDEALSVGDIFFQQKSFSRMREIISSGTTCIFVTHDMSAIHNLCSRVMYLNGGKVELIGDPMVCISLYSASQGRSRTRPATDPGPGASPLETVGAESPLARQNVIAHSIFRSSNVHQGGKEVELLAASFWNPVSSYAFLVEIYSAATITVLFRANAHVSSPNLGFTLFDRMNNLVFSTSTYQRGFKIGPMKPGSERLLSFRIGLAVQPGEYTFTLGCGEVSQEDDGQGYTFHRVLGLGPIQVVPRAETILPFYGVADLPTEILSG